MITTILLLGAASIVVGVSFFITMVMWVHGLYQRPGDEGW